MADDESVDNPYVPAIMKAWVDLQEAQEQERQLTLKKAQLKQTIDAIFPLAFPDFKTEVDITSMTLADTIRLVVKSCGRPVSVKEMRGKLQDLGFDLSKYSNVLASIHTAIARMVDSEELIWTDEDGKKISAGPELKPVASNEPDIGALLGMMGDNTAGEK